MTDPRNTGKVEQVSFERRAEYTLQAAYNEGKRTHRLEGE